MHWYAWAGWNFIGVVAQVISLAALAFAIYELLLRRRREVPVLWGLDRIGTLTNGTETYHALEFYNSGRGTASIVTATFVGASPRPFAEHRYRSVMGPGDHVTIPLTSPSIQDAWFLVTWRSDDDAHRVNVHWMPVAQPGRMNDLWLEAVERRRRTRARDRLLRTIRAVGPGGAVRTSFRLPRSKKRRKGRIDKALGLLYEEGGMYSWSYSHETPVADLPFIPAVRPSATDSQTVQP